MIIKSQPRYTHETWQQKQKDVVADGGGRLKTDSGVTVMMMQGHHEVSTATQKLHRHTGRQACTQLEAREANTQQQRDSHAYFKSTDLGRGSVRLILSLLIRKELTFWVWDTGGSKHAIHT